MGTDAIAPDGSEIYHLVGDAERASLVEVRLAARTGEARCQGRLAGSGVAKQYGTGHGCKELPLRTGGWSPLRWTKDTHSGVHGRTTRVCAPKAGNDREERAMPTGSTVTIQSMRTHRLSR